MTPDFSTFITFLLLVTLGFFAGVAYMTHNKGSQLNQKFDELSALAMKKAAYLDQRQQELNEQASALSIEKWAFSNYVTSTSEDV